jgi:hypothetical protein
MAWYQSAMEGRRRGRGGRFVATAFAAAALAGCTGDPPATFVGESAHFRLYVDPELLPLAAPFATADDALSALETEWADVETMVHMPDGKITYRWYTSAHAADACGPDEGGCTKEGQMEIDAPTLPNAHELNHAYAYLRAHRRPIPLLAEGLAEAIACDGEALGANPADWRAMVASLSSEEVQTQGGLFVRTLIRTYGIDAFLRYYEQSPERRDPALFGANFAEFWGVSLDEFWAEAHGGASGFAPTETRICPCSLPALVPGEPIVNDLARAPYWTLPTGGLTLALTRSPLGARILDCAGSRRSPPSGDSFLARLDSGAGWFVPAPLQAASVDNYLANDCASAVHFPVTMDPYGLAFLAIAIPVSETSAGVYLALDLSSPAEVDYTPLTVCDTCAFGEGGCQPVSGADGTPVSGSFYVRLAGKSFSAFAGADVAWSQMRFIW